MLRNSGRVKISVIIVLTLVILLPALLHGYSTTFAVKPPAVPIFLDPKTIPKYVNQLVVPPVYTPDTPGGTSYTVEMTNLDSTGLQQYRQQILPTAAQGMVLPGTPTNPDGKTSVWGYKGTAVTKGLTLGVPEGTTINNFIFSPSATFEAVRGTPITVKWINNVNVPQPFAIDPTLYWANPTKVFPDGDVFATQGAPFPPFPPGYDGVPILVTNPNGLDAQSPVALVPHLHGSEVDSRYDGGPEAWWTSATSGFHKGKNYNTLFDAGPGTAVYQYANNQEPNLLWYHDHALGITRINVMSGLAGLYFLRASFDPLSPAPTTVTTANLDEYLAKTFKYGISEIPIAIQDRTFKANGELWFPEVGINPTVHPYWMPEFFGNTIMVNGRVWPNLDVTPGWYRFRLLDGSNARFYTLSFDNKMPFTMIGADGGYLQQAAIVNQITIAPGERADVLVQFTPAMVGSKIILKNTAKAPFPNGATADPQTTGQIMQFTVKATTDPTWTNGVQGQALATLPTSLNPTLPVGAFPTLPTTTNKRLITLNEVMGPAGPLMVMINGQYYRAPATETPSAGTEEEWVIINLTADTHPIHTHLVTFQLVSRQPFQATKYNTAWIKAQPLDPTTGLNYAPPFPIIVTPTTLDPTPYYQGKTILPTPTEMGWKDTLQMNPGEVTTIRIKFTSQDGAAFPATWFTGPGYVWHCHIIDHEDNEMMRPLIVG
jgi:spore coat protein A, manganese oxidase